MTMNVGIVGCGNISDTYLQNGPLLRDINYIACADLRFDVAEAKASKYGIEAASIDALLARDDVDIILNLTVPAAHAEVSLRAIAAGKHVYTEKPLAISLAEGRSVLEAAAFKGVRVGSAPDTILGPGLQAARAIVDSGKLGDVVTGLATVMSHGMEDWHPNPAFFFQKGAGPVLDMGPYYVTALINMLGPVKRVQATGRIGTPERLVTAEGPMKGQTVKVETFTSLNALLSFESGAEIAFLASWDVWNYDLRPIELHGTAGTLRVPDPNNFGGTVDFAAEAGAFASEQTATLPFGADNRLWADEYPYSCYRGMGLADMARSIKAGVPHRCSGELGYHALDVMLAIEEAALQHRVIELGSTCARPAALSSEEAALFAADAA
ncbi:Gfo/Idh/MocA family protein [Pararhizobium gei]|uniref:Gfo/Idh/MocA family protein n=1 Tax=Pararhizobium gei TaxID=1395951 RepID=UPI0023DB6831|nr:Gfo/Idh/MocA family oxidoreductase [Rhizobium gei]